MPTPTTFNVIDYNSSSSTTSGIQEAIDAVPESGGTVLLPAGKSPIRRSIVLKSYVTLRGEGAASVITRPKERRTTLTKRTTKNRTQVSLENTSGLRVGDEIMVSDNPQGGYWARHGIISEIKDGRLNLELLECDPERAYSPTDDAYAANYFPALWLPRVSGVTIESLTIDGGTKRHRVSKGNFTNAGVHSRGSNDIRVLNINVRNWQADGIGIQGGSGATVSGCIVENSRGPGLHPGTSITNNIWSNNISRFNTTDGFFFCLRVTQAVVTGNLLYGNGRCGVANLTDPDRYNVVANNIIAENKEHGVEAIRAIGNSIQGNIIRNNSQKKRGQFAGIYLEGHSDNVVADNVFIDDQKRPTQTRKIVSLNPAGYNVIQDT